MQDQAVRQKNVELEEEEEDISGEIMGDVPPGASPQNNPDPSDQMPDNEIEGTELAARSS